MVAVYKKASEDEFWARRKEFQATVREYFDRLDELDAEEKIDEWLRRVRMSEEFTVHPE